MVEAQQRAAVLREEVNEEAVTSQKANPNSDQGCSIARQVRMNLILQYNPGLGLGHIDTLFCAAFSVACDISAPGAPSLQSKI